MTSKSTKVQNKENQNKFFDHQMAPNSIYMLNLNLIFQNEIKLTYQLAPHSYSHNE